jgi:hypothetical protein
MATTEIQKLDRLARFSQKEFFYHGSKLGHAKLGRFILIAFLLHISVVIFELIIPLNIKNPLRPPPVKVKYVDTQKPEHFKKKETTIDPIKLNKKKETTIDPIKLNKKKETKSSGPLAYLNHKTFVKKQYPKQKKYRQKKSAVPKIPSAPINTQTQSYLNTLEHTRTH